MAPANPRPSSLFSCEETTQEDDLAILHMRRDDLIATVLKSYDENDEGYAEGKVTNTRFGSFPHSTLLGLPWGSQVQASQVDTGSRGRRDLKRKRGGNEARGEIDGAGSRGQTTGPVHKSKTATKAQSGFLHLLPPTPERWTGSLPHRTQVVYTPDYSYILQRLKAKPGDRIIEAGAGSGSFTHAAARAVYRGHDPAHAGKVYSFEFHQARYEKLQREIQEHGLSDVVELTAGDVCNNGFIPSRSNGAGINATAVFLDLPAPWLALRHLTHDAPKSPLSPHSATHLCTFSPCIEQVQRTVNMLRQYGWLEIDMVEIAAKRIEIRRERVGIHEQGQRGANDSPATVEEALYSLNEQEKRQTLYHSRDGADGTSRRDGDTAKQNSSVDTEFDAAHTDKYSTLYKEGKLITRTEPDLKAHTSYLVFAILPRPWSEKDEEAARARWPEKVEVEEKNKPVGKKAKRKAEIAAGSATVES